MRTLAPANLLWVGTFGPGLPGAVEYENAGRRIKPSHRILVTQATGAAAKHNGLWRPAPSGPNLVPSNAAFNAGGSYTLTLPEDEVLIWYPGGNSEGAFIRLPGGNIWQASPEAILFWADGSPNNVIELLGPPSEDVYDQIYRASMVRTSDADESSDWNESFTVTAESLKFQWTYDPGFVLGTSDVVLTQVGTSPSLPWDADTIAPSTSLAATFSRSTKAWCERVTDVSVEWPSGILLYADDTTGRLLYGRRYLIRHLTGGNAPRNGIYQLDGSGSNLISGGSTFNGSGEFTLTGLSFESVYLWIRGNATSLRLDGGSGATLTESGAFQNNDPYTSVKLYGPANATITDQIRVARLVRTADADEALDWMEDFKVAAGYRLFLFVNPGAFTLGTSPINFIELTTG